MATQRQSEGPGAALTLNTIISIDLTLHIRKTNEGYSK